MARDNKMYYISENFNLKKMDTKIKKSIDEFSMFSHSIIKDHEKIKVHKRSKSSMTGSTNE